MPNLDLTDWLFLGVPIVCLIALLVLLKLAYRGKKCMPMPASKPGFCVLPKYELDLPVQDASDLESEVAGRLAELGFRECGRTPTSIRFSRGSEAGDFSLRVAKLIASVHQPLSKPVRMKLEYGMAFGCAFDTGDLWQFCSELREKVATSVTQQPTPEQAETGNPYQPPQT